MKNGVSPFLYKFTRYFSPLDHNQPSTIAELYEWNDVELFDLDSDSEELVNLGNDTKANHDLIMAMNTKLETLIKSEIGVDNGHELPNIPFVNWALEKVS